MNSQTTCAFAQLKNRMGRLLQLHSQHRLFEIKASQVATITAEFTINILVLSRSMLRRVDVINYVM